LSLRFASLAGLDKLELPEADERRKVVALRNPLSEEWGTLPSTYIPLLLATVARNRNYQEPDVRFFEIGRGFFSDASQAGPKDPAVREERLLCLAIVGEWDDCAWDGRKDKVDFSRLRGLMEGLNERLGANFEFRAGAEESFLHPVESARCVGFEGVDCGAFGMLHPRVASAFGLKGPVAVAEIRLDRVPFQGTAVKPFRAYSLHSGTTRDINLLVPDAVRHADVLAAMPKALSGLESVRLNSVYRGQGIPDGHKALHYTFTYRSSERSLTDEEVNGLQEGLRRELEQHEGFRIK
jgi:phenylalanyl-tRNA synthetase beta chain